MIIIGAYDAKHVGGDDLRDDANDGTF